MSYTPFTVDKATAATAFSQWLQSLRFVPAQLKRTADLDSLKRVYVPFWVVTSVSSGYDVGERGRCLSEQETYTDSSGENKTRDWESGRGGAAERR